MKSILFKSGFAILLLTSLTSAYYMWEPRNFISTSYKGVDIVCERGEIYVRSNRSEALSKMLIIDYVVLKSTSENPKSPIFYLAGGPGNGATQDAENKYSIQGWVPYLKDRDVVLIDQRGIGKWKLWWVNLSTPNEDAFISEEGYSKYILECAKKAKQTFDNRGIDLSGYNTIESAFDIDEVRQHLAYDKIIPFGFSYGSHLGMAYMKYFEEKVDKAILVGPEGLGQSYKMPMELDKQLEHLSALVNQDSILSQDIPDLVALYDRVASKLSQHPIPMEVENLIKLDRTVQVGKFALDYILRRDFGDANDIPNLPKLLHSIDNGDYSILHWFVQKRYKEWIILPAMTISMDIASGLSPERASSIEEQAKESRFGNVNNAPFFDLKEVWNVKDLGSDFRDQLQSDLPTLILSGSLDCNTPAHQGHELLRTLKNGTHISVENAGHEQILHAPNSYDVVLGFLNGEDVSDVEMKLKPIQFTPINK